MYVTLTPEKFNKILKNSIKNHDRVVRIWLNENNWKMVCKLYDMAISTRESAEQGIRGCILEIPVYVSGNIPNNKVAIIESVDGSEDLELGWRPKKNQLKEIKC